MGGSGPPSKTDGAKSFTKSKVQLLAEHEIRLQKLNSFMEDLEYHAQTLTRYPEFGREALIEVLGMMDEVLIQEPRKHLIDIVRPFLKQTRKAIHDKEIEEFYRSLNKFRKQFRIFEDTLKQDICQSSSPISPRWHQVYRQAEWSMRLILTYLKNIERSIFYWDNAVDFNIDNILQQLDLIVGACERCEYEEFKKILQDKVGLIALYLELELERTKDKEVTLNIYHALWQRFEECQTILREMKHLVRHHKFQQREKARK